MALPLPGGGFMRERNPGELIMNVAVATKPQTSGLLNVSRSDVSNDPFPHVVSQQILPPELFARLKADYPDASTFAGQVSEHKAAGSRTGNGFDIYRGDEAYDALIRRSSAWAEFDAFINSQAFVDQFVDLFGDTLHDIGCTADIASSRYDGSYVEPRSVLTETLTLKERMEQTLHKLTNRKRDRKVDLFTRLDIQRAVGGYAKNPHCDRANRLCSLIVYFSDAESTGLEGGELLIYKHKQAKAPAAYERHPKPEDVEIVARLKSKPNLGVFFPCCNNSYHGVTAVTSNGIARDFLYINISGRSTSLW